MLNRVFANLTKRTGLGAALCVGATVALALFATPGKALAGNTWYVSSQTSGSQVRDGKSWATAWGDFSYQYNANNRIDWSKVQPGDRIMIDAGSAPPPGYSKSVAYHTPLIVQKSGISIEVSREYGHDGGFVTIQSTKDAAIDLATYNVSNVSINGSKWMPSPATKYCPQLNVLGGGTGIRVGKNAKGIDLRCIQVSWCDIGLQLLGGAANCSYLMLDDNLTNVSSTAQAATNSLVYINNSWIFNMFTRRTVGISTNNDPSASAGITCEQCILGPNLSKAIETNGTRDYVKAKWCLLINSTVSQLQVNKPSALVSMEYCTSFMTPLNEQGQAHSCVRFAYSPTVSAVGSIFYGGVVDVTVIGGLFPYSYNNVQFKTSGNTMVLGNKFQDPGFKSKVSDVLNNASFSQLINLDLTPTATPQYGAFTVKSVNDLCNHVPR